MSSYASSERFAQEGKGNTKILDGSIAGTGSSSNEAFLGLLGGMVFGLCSPITGHPFDTIKSKMQVEPAYKDFGFFKSIQVTYTKDGIRGFYRGFLPPIVGSVMYRGLSFSAYSGTYAACNKYPLLQEEIPFTLGLRPCVLVAAFAAAFARATIESPLDFIKLRHQIGEQAFENVSSSQQKGTSNNVMSTLRHFASSPVNNMVHLYSGYLPTLYRTVGLLSSFFVLVDYSVRYIPDVVNAPLIGPFFKGGICATAGQ
jgi:hypothetical protein